MLVDDVLDRLIRGEPKLASRQDGSPFWVSWNGGHADGHFLHVPPDNHSAQDLMGHLRVSMHNLLFSLRHRGFRAEQ